MLQKRDLLRPGQTCWRTAVADRAAILIDTDAYFTAVQAALRMARHCVLLIGWNFDPATRLDPRSDGDGTPIGKLLTALADERPELEIRVLIWNMAPPLSAKNRFIAQRSVLRFRRTRVKYRLDRIAPIGASQHQKILVVDDAIAFCGGGDFAPERWDTCRHGDHDPRRRLANGKPYPPRHEVMMMVEGPAAAMLGDLARERWRRATGEVLDSAPACRAERVRPDGITPDFGSIAIAASRTEPARGGRAAVRENEALHLEAIAAAHRTIFLENQYFSSPVIAEALAARLIEPDGPEVLVVCSGHSPGFLDRFCMDTTRKHLVERLRQVDRFGRFHIYAPFTAQGRPIIVHSKVAVVDDRLLRIGSTNLNNRSMALDSECDLAMDTSHLPQGSETRAGVLRFRDRLIGHYLGQTPARIAETVAETGSLHAAIEALDDPACRRLRRVASGDLGPLERLIARYHLGDPQGVRDAWRPWRRRRGAGPYLRSLIRKSTTTGK